MKKLIYCALALAAGLFAASCQQENLEPVAQENTVTYTVELPTAQTKGFMGTVSKVDQLVYEVWKTEKANERDLKGTTEGKANATRLYQKVTVMPPTQKRVITLNLLQDQEYTVLFWAQKAAKEGETPVYNTANLTDVHYNNVESLLSNQESYEAYYATEFISDGDKKSRTVVLKRPFAQLNLGTKNTQMENTGKEFGEGEYNVEVVSSKVTVSNVGTRFNIATPEKEDAHHGVDMNTATSVTFETATDPSNEFETITVNGETYEYIAMNYLFAAGDNVTVDYEINTVLTGTSATTDAKVSNIVYEVPLKENYRTNIVGNLLTSSTQYQVIVDATWENEGQEPPYLVELWDGETITEPEFDETTQTYTITYGSELAWLAAAVNGTLPAEETVQAKSGETTTIAPNAFAGKTFVLSQNINLDNHDWTPIGSSANPFKGTFNGNGKIISNLVVQGGSSSDMGLFGATRDGEIKNFIIENANVSGRLNVGVVAGTPYTSKYTDITVKGHVEVNGMAYVGAVGGKNAYADWTNITVNVDETSYVNANSVENGTAYRTYVGGVVGFNGEGGHKFKNITSNIDVKGSTCDVGGLFGIAHYSNQFENCVCKGNVEIYDAEEAEEAQQIGGIAGVWHNATDYTVTFTNCRFDGELQTNIENLDLYYDGLVGAPYSATGKGKLIIDGVQYVATAAELQEAVDAATGETTICVGYNINGDVTIEQKADVKITIEGNDYIYNGVITVDGKSATYTTAGLIIKDLTFAAETISADACVRLGDGSNGTRYTCNVTLDNCTFDVPGAVGVKSYTGGDKNLTINACTATSNAHSLVQAKGIDGINVTGCTVGSKNGMNFNNSTNVEVNNCTTDVKGYAARFGESDGGVGAAEVYSIKNSTLKSACENGDAVIILRGTADYSTLTIENTILDGTNLIANGATDATVTIDGCTPVATSEELLSAIAVENASIYLTSSEYVFTKKISIAKGVTIRGNGASMLNDWSSNLFNKQTTLENVTIVGVNFTNNTILDMAYAKGNVSFKDCVFSHVRGNQSIHFDGQLNAKVVFENCTMYGRNMLAASLDVVEFNNCKFRESTWNTEQGNKGVGTGWSGVNMWGKYEFNNCQFDEACHCNVKSEGIVATFNNCSYTNGGNIQNVITGTDANIAGSTITFN